MPPRGTPTSAQGTMAHDASSYQQPSTESDGHGQSNPAARQTTSLPPTHPSSYAHLYTPGSGLNEPFFYNQATNEGLLGHQANDFNAYGARTSDACSIFAPAIAKAIVTQCEADPHFKQVFRLSLVQAVMETFSDIFGDGGVPIQNNGGSDV